MNNVFMLRVSVLGNLIYLDTVSYTCTIPACIHIYVLVITNISVYIDIIFAMVYQLKIYDYV